MPNRVSIVIPCYRQAHFLRSAVNSALAQSYPDVEVIVVNDGSDDDTEQVAAAYGDRIRYVFQRNAGLPAARNAGIRIATGDFFVFLDSDDALESSAVEKMIEEAEANARDIVVIGYATFLDDPAQPCEWVRAPTDDPLRYLIHANFRPPHGFLVSAPLIRRIRGFEESLASCEDWDCWIRAALEGGSFGFVDDVGALYRNTPGSMSKNLPRMLQERTRVLLRTHRRIVDRPELLKQLGTDLAQAEHRVLRRLYAQRHPDTQLVRDLLCALDELKRNGVSAPASRLKGLVERVCGTWTDWLAVQWFRLREPKMYAYYLGEYW